jgi:hypothetical protein
LCGVIRPTPRVAYETAHSAQFSSATAEPIAGEELPRHYRINHGNPDSGEVLFCLFIGNCLADSVEVAGSGHP